MDNHEIPDERVVQPGEDDAAHNLIITIEVEPTGNAKLGVNREAIPVEILHFYLHYMALALMTRHQNALAQAQMQRESLVIPSSQLLIPR